MNEPRFGAPSIERIGTDESEWASWLARTPIPTLPLPQVASVTVVAAHPDDDIFGVGGTLSALAQAGCRLRFLLLTDGDASHPHSTVLTPFELARVRRAETRAALSVLDIHGVAVTHLGLPDGAVGEHRDQVRAAVTQAVAGAELVLAPWSADGHPDHEEAGRAALTAAEAASVPCWEFPVWAWHWGKPDEPQVPWERARHFVLDPLHHARKQAAIGCFATQIRPLGPGPDEGPILTSQFVDHFRRDTETVLVP